MEFPNRLRQSQYDSNLRFLKMLVINFIGVRQDVTWCQFELVENGLLVLPNKLRQAQSDSETYNVLKYFPIKMGFGRLSICLLEYAFIFNVFANWVKFVFDLTSN